MNALERFGAYAAAFETFVENDDTAVLEPFFATDAVYEILGGPPFAGRHEGRDAVFAHLRASLDGFDRRFAERELELRAGPTQRDDEVWMAWRATYRTPGLPELVIDGEERVRFENDRIVLLQDEFELAMSGIVERWFTAHGEQLAGSE